MNKMDVQQQFQLQQQSQPRISFSSNGSGVSLHFTLVSQPSYSHLPTQQIIPFSTQEFSFYETLFKVIDINNDGLLLLPQNTQALSLLLRTQLTWQGDILPAIAMVTQELLPVNPQQSQSSPITESVSGSPVYVLQLPQWLLLCKLLAIFKQQRESQSSPPTSPNSVKTILWQCMSIMSLSSVSLSFHLSLWKPEEKEGHNVLGEVCYQVYRPEVVSWKTYGDDSLKTQHVKYNIVTDIDTFVSSTLLLSSVAQNKDNGQEGELGANNAASESSEVKDNHPNKSNPSTTTTNNNNNNSSNNNNKKKKNKKPSISSVSSLALESSENQQPQNKTVDSFMTVVSSESSHSSTQSSADRSNRVLHVPSQRVLIERRYSDFVSLVSQLRHVCPGVLLPPLPKKEDLLQNLTNNSQFYYFYSNNNSNNNSNSSNNNNSNNNNNAMVSSSPPVSSFLGSLSLPSNHVSINNSNNSVTVNSATHSATHTTAAAMPSGTSVNSVTNRRRLELQLFFNALLFQHPQLSQVFAVQVFLSASPPALKAFFDLDWHLLETSSHTKSTSNNTNNNNNNTAKINVNSNNRFTSTTTSHSSSTEDYPDSQNTAAATTQSVWGFTQMLGKAVSSLTEAVVKQVVPLVSYFSGKEPNIFEYYGLHHSNNNNNNNNSGGITWTEDDLKAQDAVYFQKIEKLGKAVESVWLGETQAMEEMVKLADVFKQMSDTEQSPSVAKLLLTFHRGLLTHATQSVSQCHTPMYIYVAVPMVYMGYYRDSFRTCGVQPLQEKERHWKQLFKDTVSCQEQLAEKQRTLGVSPTDKDSSRSSSDDDDALEDMKRLLQEREEALQTTGRDFVAMFRGLAEDTERLKQQQRVSMVTHLKRLAELRLDEVRRSRSHWEDVKWQLLQQQQQQQHPPLFS